MLLFPAGSISPAAKLRPGGEGRQAPSPERFHCSMKPCQGSWDAIPSLHMLGPSIPWQSGAMGLAPAHRIRVASDELCQF